MAYSNEEREAALTVLEANGGNLKKTAREMGIPAITLRDWRDKGKAKPSPEKAAALVESYLDKAKRTREALLDRLMALAPTETDMYKVAGAYKIVAEAAASEEVDRALTRRISAAQSPPAQSVQDSGRPGGGNTTFN